MARPKTRYHDDCPMVRQATLDVETHPGVMRLKLTLGEGGLDAREMTTEAFADDCRRAATLRNVYVRRVERRQKVIMTPVVPVALWEVVGWRCDLCRTFGPQPKIRIRRSRT